MRSKEPRETIAKFNLPHSISMAEFEKNSMRDPPSRLDSIVSNQTKTSLTERPAYD